MRNIAMTGMGLMFLTMFGVANPSVAMAHEAGMAGMEQGKEITIKGELVDSLCYVAMGA